jgi:hypothetical protein
MSTSHEAHYAVISTLLSLPPPVSKCSPQHPHTLPQSMFCPCRDVAPHPYTAAGRHYSYILYSYIFWGKDIDKGKYYGAARYVPPSVKTEIFSAR